ncbi:unnamed protein product [Lactuca virosa]|uniref:Uncharacterized protein n=1 Tax=Lactuca virosa TaxID=75947 RepID=A0AAU9M5Y4_9ASTR|nr:unnamed protein product [Lactuca virosa]
MSNFWQLKGEERAWTPQVSAKYILEPDHIKKLFKSTQDLSFDIASDATSIFRVNHLESFMFFYQLQFLLPCILYICLPARSNVIGSFKYPVMVRYVCSLDNMRIIMNILRDSNKTIQLEAFHLFKPFPANQKKPPQIVNALFANRSKLICFFNNFTFEKDKK